jgi:hypothetical protein
MCQVEKSFKTELLGKHVDGLIEATFDHQPRKAELLELLPTGYAMWLYCLGCGCKTPLTLIQASVMIKFHLNLEFETTKGKYLESKKCSFCDSQQDGFALKEVEDIILD